MYSEENENNNDFQIVMGDDAELNISEVGDIMNSLKPHSSEKKQNIIIPISKKKEQNSNDNEEDEDEENSENTKIATTIADEDEIEEREDSKNEED